MKTYLAIGHFSESENITSVALSCTTLVDFRHQLAGNTFIPFVVITGNKLAKLESMIKSDDCFAVYDEVKKMTTNYRKWNVITDYIEQCFDILVDRYDKASIQ